MTSIETKSPSRFAQVIVVAALIILPLLIFCRVSHHEFVSYDDGDYVYENRMVQKGLTLESIKWAFTARHAANWHPLTWLSHMLDWNFYNENAGRHHITSVFIHIGNTLLLFFVLNKMTRRYWLSALVAALFGLHPLHVESVAWLAERKDVLSTFFGLLTFWSYILYVERKRHGSQGKVKFYILTLFFFACSLMSKPMLVTMPFVLLLLDFWPLNRAPLVDHLPNTFERERFTWKRYMPKLLRLGVEKIPFLLLSIISSYVTVQVQMGKTVQSLSNFTLLDRISNVLVTYVIYLWKMVWPAKLAFFYPLVKAPPLWQAALAGLFLAGITALVIWQISKRPFLATGWFWYLGTLVPVIGLVHVGEQSHADRYTYIPSIGIFFAVAWILAELAEKKEIPKKYLGLVTSIVLIAFSIVAFRQVGFWKNSRVMLERAIAVTKQNFLAHNNLGVILADEGRYAEATEHYKEAIRWKPLYARAYDNWASSLTMQGKLDEAVEKYRETLKLIPNEARTHHNLAVTLARQSKYDEAIAECREALRLNPNYVDAHYDIGSALSLKGDLNGAVAEYETYLKAKPEDGVAHYLLANVLTKQTNFTRATFYYREAIRLQPDYLESYTKLAWILATNPDPKVRNGAEAVKIAERAVQMSSQSPVNLGILAASYAEAGRFEAAITMAQRGISIADKTGKKDIATSLRQQLQLYREGLPVR